MTDESFRISVQTCLTLYGIELLFKCVSILDEKKNPTQCTKALMKTIRVVQEGEKLRENLRMENM